MERHESNIERVINSSTLFEPDNLYQAKDILLRLIHNREYVKNDTFVLDHILAKREYNNQFSKLISSLNKIEKKILHISTVDYGGAGTAAYNLHKSFMEAGNDSRMIVLNKNE